MRTDHNQTDTENKKLIWIVVSVILALTLARIILLWATDFDLYFDEAQYWFWAQTPDWGYYSKPPMVAWLIYVTTSVCGSSEACIRVSSPILHMLTACFIYGIGMTLYSKRVGAYAALVYATLPAVTLSSLLISTDPILLFWTAAFLFCFIRSVQTNRWHWWLLAAVAAGCGMLSKYNMVLAFLSALFYLLTSPSHRSYLAQCKFWVSAGFAFLIFLPNVWWNVENGFVSFLHTKDNANLEGELFHPKHMAEFVAAQFGVFGPILFGCLLLIITRLKRIWASEGHRVAWWFIIPLLGLITMISLLSRAHANWAVAIYVPASVLVAAWLLEDSKRHKWLHASIGLHVFVMIIALNSYPLIHFFGFQVVSNKTDISKGEIQDPFVRLRGWKELGDRIRLKMQLTHTKAVLVDSRRLFAALSYYLGKGEVPMAKWNPSVYIKDHFDLTTDIHTLPYQKFLFISQEQKSVYLERYFKHVKEIEMIDILSQREKERRYFVYWVAGFKGYGL